jgi:hypothetical protein
MAISTQLLFERMCQVMAQGASNPNFETAYLQCLALTLQDIESRTGKAISMPADLSQDMSADPKYTPVVESGLSFFMADMGYKNDDVTEKIRGRYYDQLRTAQMLYQKDQGMKGKLGDLTE